MVVKLSELKDGVNRWDCNVSVVEAGLDDPDRFHSEVHLEIIADKRLGKVQIRVSANTVLQAFCDRCGDDLQYELSGENSVLFVKRDAHLPDELPGDEMRTFLPGQDVLDITTEIRDALLLAVPMKILCREDCQGICPVCGANWNFEECNCNLDPIESESTELETNQTG